MILGGGISANFQYQRSSYLCQVNKALAHACVPYCTAEASICWTFSWESAAALRYLFVSL